MTADATGMLKIKMKRMVTAIVIVAVALIAIKFIMFPPVKEIPTTGKYNYTSEDYWVTENKVDPYSRKGENRQLQVRKWYPTDCSEQKPVVVASHGSCGTIGNNLTLYRELASHGYTVLAVAHPGQAASVRYENGRKSGPSGDFLKELTALNPDGDLEKGYEVYATGGTAKFFNENGVKATTVNWPDEEGDNNVMDMIAQHKFSLIVNVPKNHTKRELTNGYRIRRGAIDHNIPLMTNVRLAKAFIEAFTALNQEDIKIKSWQEYDN